MNEQKIVIQQNLGRSQGYQELWPKTDCYTKEESDLLFNYSIGDVKFSCNRQNSEWIECLGQDIPSEISEETKKLIDSTEERWNQSPYIKKDNISLPTSWLSGSFIQYSNCISTNQYKYVFCSNFTPDNSLWHLYVFYSNDLTQWNTLELYSSRSLSSGIKLCYFNNKLRIFFSADSKVFLFSVADDFGSFEKIELDSYNRYSFAINFAKIIGEKMVVSYQDAAGSYSHLIFFNSSLEQSKFVFPTSWDSTAGQMVGARAGNIFEKKSNYHIIAYAANHSGLIYLYTIPKTSVIAGADKTVDEGENMPYFSGKGLGFFQRSVIGEYLYVSANTSVYRTLIKDFSKNSVFEEIGTNLSENINLTVCDLLTYMGKQILLSDTVLLEMQNGKITKEFQFVYPETSSEYKKYLIFNGFIKSPLDSFIKGFSIRPGGLIWYNTVYWKIPYESYENWKCYIKIQ